MSPRFVAIGHFCYDIAPDGYVLGGGAAYSTITARNLGCRACAVTAVGSNFDRGQPTLDGIDVPTTNRLKPPFLIIGMT